MNEPIHIISLGAGVQSSTMALMAAHGEIKPMPKAAIFADTQCEPSEVYWWLEWLEKTLPFPVYRVTAGNLAESALKMKRTHDGRLYSKTDIPFFTLDKNTNEIGKIVQRVCTRDFKLLPLRKKQRELASIKRGQKTIGAVTWVGISLDEIYRMKPSRDPWASNRWPLVELGMKRHDCLLWMKKHNYPKPPRSACIFCPYHNNTEWRRLKFSAPQEFAEAANFERKIQDVKSKSANFSSVPFLHRSCTPLEMVDFDTEEERGQLNMFNNECSGMCGV